MSLENVKAFFEKVTSDPELTQKAKKIGTSDWKATEEFAKSLGFDFDDEDLISYYKQNLPSSSDLDEAELSSVAGGTVSAIAVAATAVAVGAVGASAGVTTTTQGGGW
jgi:predicted ribosomally synthesized peptide with nif11-like leader